MLTLCHVIFLRLYLHAKNQKISYHAFFIKLKKSHFRSFLGTLGTNPEQDFFKKQTGSIPFHLT